MTDSGQAVDETGQGSRSRKIMIGLLCLLAAAIATTLLMLSYNGIIHVSLYGALFIFITMIGGTAVGLALLFTSVITDENPVDPWDPPEYLN